MATLDGITGTRAATARPKQHSAPAKERRVRSNSRGGGFFVFLLALTTGTIGILWAGQQPQDGQAAQNVSETPVVTSDSAELPAVATPATTSESSEPIVLDEPTPSSAPQPEITSRAVTQPKADSSPSVEDVEKQLPSVRILNGGAPQGSAGTLKTQLEKLGYTVLAIGNARTTYSQTTAYYAPTYENNTNTLLKSIQQLNIAKEESTIVSPANILIVLGKDWK